jgi:LuxR family transcriptional regulator, maltose regulon positive regulatory protein
MTSMAGGPALSAAQLDAELLEDKLRVPQPGLSVLPRRRVGDLIDAGVSRRVTLITGPPGSGKTVAAAQWAAAKPASRRPAWVSLDASDREPRRFWRYVTAALSSAGAMTASRPAAPPGAAGPPPGIAAAEIPQWIAAIVRRVAEPVVLVLDDVHLLTGSEALAGLDELIRHEPAGLRLLLTARSAPGLALARLRLAGELADIGPAELACTAEETEAYFAMLGTQLSPAACDRVVKRTEGWLAGLRLTALGADPASPSAPVNTATPVNTTVPVRPAALVSTPAPVGAAVPVATVPPAAGAPVTTGPPPNAGPGVTVSPAGGTGPVAPVADYLQDELLGQLASEVRTFMLRTCLTPTVPADLARDLTGDAGAARLLEQLSRECGLVQPVSPDAAEYRYHPMLREVLFADLSRELPDEFPVLQGRVARWHADRGDVLAAVQAAASAGDWDFGVRLLRDAGPAVLMSPAAPVLEAALVLVPSGKVAADGMFALALAAARLWQGDADGALPHLEAAENALVAPAAPDGQHGPADARSRPGEAEIWVAALRVLHKAAVSAAAPGWLDRELSLASQAHIDPRGVAEHRALGVLWLALGFAALREFDSQLARSALLHASSQLSAGALLALRERGRAFEAVACALYGDLAAAARLAASVTDGPHGGDDDLRPVLALAGAAVSLARDEPRAAAALLDQADLAAMAPRPAGEPSIAVLSGFLRARLAVAEGNLAGARGLVRWLTDAVAGSVPAGFDLAGPELPGQPNRGHGAAAVISVLDAEISLAAGERERARATLADLVMTRPGGRTEQAAPEATADMTAQPEASICEARLLIADSDEKGAIEQVAPLIAGSAGACAVTDRIAALLTAVVAHRRLNQSAEAAELLSLALALAEPEEACGPFVGAGPPVRSALTVLVSPSSRSAGFASRILERFDMRLPRPAGSHPGALLTDSELAVLRFLPSHMTNQEIAEALFLSINTIKTHLSSVYRKLGVANRRQAIAQGRRLDLLLRRA